ncbi:DUF389 domain-containing protein [Halorientalis pallida]|uniref:DUF389 domain-containing protein n=1 Tax=Halorientalis pallida TaxID=2479928 RepID=A0A498L6R1_9EURY|nr:DUF389 domain-containing protein [Halorientalis pallida]RXK51415.1 DUF389 domain-containing protein [Halorientalis pallida]
MRLVHLSVPDADRAAVVGVLDDRNLGYVETAGAGDLADRTLVSVVVPADAVEHLLDDLEAVGYDDDTYTVSLAAEFASFPGIDAVQDEWAATPNKLAPATLRSKAKDLRYNTQTYLWMMFLSTVVATAGLLLDSPATVVGSMVLAPIVGPTLTGSVGAVRRDWQMVVDSVYLQLLGMGLAVGGAVVVGLATRWFLTVPPSLAVTSIELVTLRLSPGLLPLVVGLAAGAAGAFGLATKGQVSIVGVMIAAALIPAAAAAGIGFAWGKLLLGLGATTLLVSTLLAVNLGGYTMFRYLGYGPDEVPTEPLAGRHERTVFLVAVIGVAVVLTGLAVVGLAQQSTFERDATAATARVLDTEPYRGLSVSDTTFEYAGVGPVSEPTTVTVTLARTGNRSYPDLPERLARRIADRTDTSVAVRVQYADYDTATVRNRDPGRDSPPSRPPTKNYFVLSRISLDKLACCSQSELAINP